MSSVALFPTCLVDLFRPSVGFACVALLEQAGYDVFVPNVTCCGQPAFNSGDRKSAMKLAEKVIDALLPHDHVVIPSGSCGGMMIKHYPQLFPKGHKRHDDANAVAAQCWELTRFLTEVADIDLSHVKTSTSLTYHDSCAGYRELDVYSQPRALLAQMQNVTVQEMEDSSVCCGFGGAFCVKYPEISNAMVGEKTKSILEAGAKTLVAGDLGCLMNMAGKLSRDGHDIEVRHIAEILAGDTDTPPLAGAGKGA